MTSPDMTAVERAAKAAFWEMCSIMHDHEEEWRKCDKKNVYRDVVRAALAALPQPAGERAERREEIAQIIDPGAWSAQPVSTVTVPHYAHIDRRKDTAREKADAVLAALPREPGAWRGIVDRLLTCGNHIALYRTDSWPDYRLDGLTREQQCESALRILGAGREYDMWCCWSGMMQERDAIPAPPLSEQKRGEPVGHERD